jgi:putative Holliday junction resolvase
VKIVALDVGEVRVGVASASCDGIASCATPVSTVIRKGDLKGDAAKVLNVVRELKPDLLLVGIPLSLDGGEGAQAKRIRRFALELERGLDVPVRLYDESLTSVEAEERMIALDMSRAKRKLVRDQWAAAILLNQYLANANEKTGNGQPSERLDG